MDTFILMLELIGTVAFAVSGAMTGLKKGMDLFGVVILGLTTRQPSPDDRKENDDGRHDRKEWIERILKRPRRRGAQNDIP